MPVFLDGNMTETHENIVIKKVFSSYKNKSNYLECKVNKKGSKNRCLQDFLLKFNFFKTLMKL